MKASLIMLFIFYTLSNRLTGWG